MNRVFRLFLLISIVAPAALATLRITPEKPIANPIPAPPEVQERLGAIATDGRDFLVVWGGAAGLYAARVTADGKVAGPRALISLSASTRETSACWTGSVFLVTWRDDAFNAIYAATLSRVGAVVVAPYVVVRGAVAGSGSLASNGRRAFMAYAAFGANPAVKGALFDAAGALVVVDLPLPVNDSFIGLVEAEAVPRVATDGSEFALVFRSAELVPIKPASVMSTPPPLSELFHTFHLLRVSDSGIAVGAAITVARIEQTGDFGVAFGGGVYAISAIENHFINIGQVQKRLVRFVADARGGVVTTFPAIDTAGWNADVLWNGSRFVAYWMNYSTSSFELLTLPFSRAPEAVAPQPVRAVSGVHLAISPLLAWNGNSIFGVWSEDIFDTHGGESAVRGAIFDSNAAAPAQGQAPFLVSVAWSRQFTPAIATSGSESLIVWIESSEPDRGRLVGVRVALDGTLIDSTPLEIAPVIAVSQPLVTFTGVAYLVVWYEPDTTTIVARRVGRDGSLGPRMPVGNGRGAAVASNATTTLVAFTGQQHLLGYRFDARGEPLDATPITIGDGYWPRVATNGTDFLVVWNVGSDYWQFSPPDLIDVYGARVSATGAVDAAPLAIATGPSDQFVEAVGSNGRDYTVFFGIRDQRYPNGVLAAKRVLREGQLDGTTPQDDGSIVEELKLIAPESIVPTAGGFWLAGVSGTYAASSIVLFHTDFRGNAGEPVSLISVNSALLLSASVSLAQAPGGPLQIAYARRITDGPYAGTSRVFFRLASDPTQTRSRAARH